MLQPISEFLKSISKVLEIIFPRRLTIPFRNVQIILYRNPYLYVVLNHRVTESVCDPTFGVCRPGTTWLRPSLHRCAQRRWRCNGVGVATPNADLFWRCCQRNVLRNGLEWAFLIWLPQEWWIKPGKAPSLESKAPAAVQCKAIKINDNQRK